MVKSNKKNLKWFYKLFIYRILLPQMEVNWEDQWLRPWYLMPFGWAWWCSWHQYMIWGQITDASWVSARSHWNIVTMERVNLCRFSLDLLWIGKCSNVWELWQITAVKTRSMCMTNGNRNINRERKKTEEQSKCYPKTLKDIVSNKNLFDFQFNKYF